MMERIFNSIGADNLLLFLHHRVTTGILISCSIILWMKVLFGTPIECHRDKHTSVSREVFNSYCLHEVLLKKPSDENLNYVYLNTQTVVTRERAFHYWIPVALFAQGILFYLPRLIWKTCDSGFFSSLSQGLDSEERDEEKKQQKYNFLLQYLLDNLNVHNSWAIWYVDIKFILDFS